MGKDKTITNVVENNLCTGCATCISLCPSSAIDLIKDDSKGIYLPHLNEGECNQCGICFDVCPGHNLDFRKLNLEIFGKEQEDIRLGNYLNCYIGYASDLEIRYNSASGGLVTALLIFALEEGIIDGALVTKMDEEKPLEPKPFIARTREGIILAAKTKYCPVAANIALKEILEIPGKYAVVGLPCHLHGIRKAEMINRRLRDRIVLHVGIFCGRGINFLATEFLLKKVGVRQEEVERIDYRGEGWPGRLTIQRKNKQPKVSKSYLDYFDNRFGSFVPWRCTLCSDMVCEFADISCGDAWLPEFADDKVGTSVVIARNKAGSDVLRSMIFQKKVELVETTIGKIAQSQGECSWKKRDLRARLTLLTLLGKRVPFYDNNILLQPSFRAYIDSSLFYLQSFLASKRSLWWLLDVYWSLREYISQVRSKLSNLK